MNMFLGKSMFTNSLQVKTLTTPSLFEIINEISLC